MNNQNRKYPRDQFQKAWQEVKAMPLTPSMMGYSTEEWNRLSQKDRDQKIHDWRQRQVFNILGSQIR